MSDLFSREELQGKVEDPTRVHRSAGESIHRLGSSGKKVAEVIGEITPGSIIHYKTKGKWSTHQVMSYLLDHTGPARIFLSTYTASEDPIRQIVKHLHDGIIQELHCIFDYRIKTYNPAAFQLISRNCPNIALVKCHAKVMVVMNDNWSLTAITSSNLNNNSRVEVGVLFTDAETAQFHSSWMKEEINGANRKTTG